MRRGERIPIVLEIFKKEILLSEFLENPDINMFEGQDILISSYKEIEKYWKENPDQRLGQVLINLDIVPDEFGLWLREEDNWLIDKGYIKIEDIKFWGNNYNKDMTPLPKTNYILLRDLTTDHIENILKFYQGRENNLNSQYLKYFLERTKDE